MSKLEILKPSYKILKDRGSQMCKMFFKNHCKIIKLNSCLIFMIIFMLLNVGNVSVARLRAQMLSDTSQQLHYVYQKGEDGYACFRIPALVRTVKGTLLAFAEARKNNCSDNGNIDLVVKRSEDSGKSWGHLQVVWNDEDNTCGNPAPVVDRRTGEIILLMTHNIGSDKEKEISQHTSKNTRRVFVTRSADDGRHWTLPQDITTVVKLAGWTWYATGPCHGIQLKEGKYAGRLIVPCDHVKSDTSYSHIIYSDDDGTTWHLGGSAPQGKLNECTVAEIGNGNILLNMRNYNRRFKCRMQSVSTDGGITWGPVFPASQLKEPVCQGSMLSFRIKRKSYLFFANPADTLKRQNMTIYVSDNKGKSWRMLYQVYRGPSAYSDLTSLSQDKIAILFEAGKETPYEGIAFEVVSVKHLF
ncbi:MAG: exo-alpha-sialidase [Chitinophagaceae bacterium]|nr:MAG: exo-alpha-sialidase [Chitinophagaceae bacterium]